MCSSDLGPVAGRDKMDQYVFRFSKPANASAATKRPTPDQEKTMAGTTWGNTTITNIDVKPGVNNGARLRTSFFYANRAYQEFGRLGEGAGPMQAGTVYYDVDGHRCELHQFPIDERSGVVCGEAPPARRVGITTRKNPDGSTTRSAILPGHVHEGYILPKKAP